MKSESIAVKLRVHDLPVTPENVARYAGGSHYRPDKERRKLAAAVLDCASTLAQPAFVYTVQDINTLDHEKGACLFLPSGKLAAGTVYIAATVCTIGPELEKETSNLLAQGKYLDALFMDAAGTALVEALSDEAHSHLSREALKEGLFTGCRFGPGYENIPGNAQKFLFESLNPEVIGVSMKPSCVLVPLKSSSFWLLWTSQPAQEGGSYKCQICKKSDCAFRIALP